MVSDKTANPQKMTLGQILLLKKFITEEQLQGALNDQKKKLASKLGALLVRLGYLKSFQLEVAVQKQKKLRETENRNVPIGEICVAENLITKGSLERALRFQKKQYRPKVGELLLKMAYVTPEQLNIAIQIQRQSQRGLSVQISKRVFANNAYNIYTAGRTNGGETRFMLKRDLATRDTFLNALAG